MWEVTLDGCRFGRNTKKNLTQSRLRPVSPFSYVGQGRKGAKRRRILTEVAKRRRRDQTHRNDLHKKATKAAKKFLTKTLELTVSVSIRFSFATFAALL
jgi:hypothetical protein